MNKLKTIILGLFGLVFFATSTPAQTTPTATTSWTVLPTAVYMPRAGLEYVINAPIKAIPTGWKAIPTLELGAFTGITARTGSGVLGSDLTACTMLKLTPTVNLYPTFGIAWESESGSRPTFGLLAALRATF